MSPTRRIAFAAAIVLATIIAYLPAIHAGYIWDDDDYVTENALLHNADGLRRIWIPGQTPQYYPMVFTTFWIEYQIWQLDPTGYHVTNVLLHAANALLLWLVMIRLRVPGAWLIAAVFALHPVHVESVAWITERKNVLSLFFYLLAVLAYLRFEALRFGGESRPTEPEETSGRKFLNMGRWDWYALALILFVLALLSKSVTCSLPAALILVMLWQRSAITVKRIIPLLPMFFIGFALAMNTAMIERVQVGAVGDDFAFTFLERCSIAARALLFYPWKLIWPADLMFIYPRWDISETALVNYGAIALVLIVGAALVGLYRRGWRGPFVALSFYAGTVFPAIGFFNVYPHLFSFVADHFVYHASIGVLACVIGGAAHLIRNPRVLHIAGVMVLAALLPLTYMQSTIYENEETLWRATIAKNPNAWMPRNNLASRLLEHAEAALLNSQHERMRDLADEARHHTAAALQARPHHHTAHSNHSEALRLLGRYEQALESIKQAIEHAGHLPDYHWQQGRLETLLGRTEDAAVSMAAAVQRAPASPHLRRDYARLLTRLGELDLAAEQFETILKLQPDDPIALGSLAGIRAEQGRHAESLDLYWTALEASQSLEQQVELVTRVIRLLTTSPDPNVRDPDQAIHLAEQIADLSQRQDPSALGMLASVYAEAGQHEQAAAVAREAIAQAQRLGMYDMARQIERQLEQYISD